MKKTLFLAALSLGLGTAASAATTLLEGEYNLHSGSIVDNTVLSPLVVHGKPNANDTSTGDGTLMMWVTLESLSSSGYSSLFSVESIQSGGQHANSQNGWGVMIGTDGKLQIAQQNVTTSNAVTVSSAKATTSASVIEAGTPFHIAISSVGGRDANSIVLYINGEQVLTSSGFGLNGAKFGELILGSSGLNGEAAGLAFDTDVLNAEGIKAVMEQTRPVPEPAAASLSLLGLTALMIRRRRA